MPVSERPSLVTTSYSMNCGFTSRPGSSTLSSMFSGVRLRIVARFGAISWPTPSSRWHAAQTFLKTPLPRSMSPFCLTTSAYDLSTASRGPTAVRLMSNLACACNSLSSRLAINFKRAKSRFRTEIFSAAAASSKLASQTSRENSTSCARVRTWGLNCLQRFKIRSATSGCSNVASADRADSWTSLG